MKVLLALDGSAPSLLARDLVANLRWPQGTDIHLLSAYEVPIDWTGSVGSTMDWVGDAEDAVRDALVRDLARMSEPLAERGLTVEHHVARGRAADVIIAVAAELGTDLVVTGSRGRGPLRSMLLGSVAAEVVANAPCPVLVARGIHASRLLVATDGSPGAGLIPQRLAEWGLFDGCPADVVAVSIPDSPAFELMVGLYTLGDERLEAMRRDLELRAGRDADEMVRRLADAGITATAHVRSGDPAAEILSLGRAQRSDLIVTGSRGLGALSRLLLGSVARNVLVNAGCSVLIVRTGSEADLSQKENQR